MSLGPSLNDLEALAFERCPRTGTSKDRGMEVIGKRMVKEEIGHWQMMPSDLQRKYLAKTKLESGLTLWKQEK